MIIKGFDNIFLHLEKEKQKNLANWYKVNKVNNEWDRNYVDADYGGPGLEGMFWDIPNGPF